MDAKAHSTADEVIRDSPEAAGALERFVSSPRPDARLAEIADEAAADAELVVRAVQQAIHAEAVLSGRRWDPDDTSELIDYIQRRHHPFVRYELRQLDALLATAGDPTRPSDPVQVLREAFHTVKAQIEDHMTAEEDVLFPWLLARQRGEARHLVSVEADAYRQMKQEHDVVESFFARARRLTDGYSTPDHASPAAIEAYRHLAALDADFRKHIWLENEFLWPGAADVEAPPDMAGICPRTGEPCPEGNPATCGRFWGCVSAALARVQEPA